MPTVPKLPSARPRDHDTPRHCKIRIPRAHSSTRGRCQAPCVVSIRVCWSGLSWSDGVAEARVAELRGERNLCTRTADRRSFASRQTREQQTAHEDGERRNRPGCNGCNGADEMTDWRTMQLTAPRLAAWLSAPLLLSFISPTPSTCSSSPSPPSPLPRHEQPVDHCRRRPRPAVGLRRGRTRQRTIHVAIGHAVVGHAAHRLQGSGQRNGSVDSALLRAHRSSVTHSNVLPAANRLCVTVVAAQGSLPGEWRHQDCLWSGDRWTGIARALPLAHDS